MSARRGTILLAAGLVAVGLTLRPQVVAIGPLAPRIEHDLQVSHAVSGLLTTVPVLCFGLLAPVAQMLMARFGPRSGLALCLGLISVFGVARAVSPWAAAVLLLTVPVGAGMALAQAMFPSLVKARFASRPALATGLYSFGINIGAASSSLAAVPLANLLGGWRGTLIALSVFAGGLVPVWLLLSRREPPQPRRAASWPKLPLHSPTGWLLVVCFSMVSFLYYGLNHWLAESFVERGWTDSHAGLLVGVMNLASLPAGLAVAGFADRVGTRRAWLMAGGSLMIASLVGVVVLPGAAWLWVVLIGVCNGVLFTLAMTLPLDVGREPGEVGAVAAMMLGFGYVIASTSPFVLGGIRDLTGSFTGSLWALVGGAALYLSLAATMTPRRLHRGVAAQHERA